jgi:hypothetical protein
MEKFVSIKLPEVGINLTMPLLGGDPVLNLKVSVVVASAKILCVIVNLTV